ncbi:hypothetical protein GCM10026983_36570 [Gracilibacillus alcaliphilus]
MLAQEDECCHIKPQKIYKQSIQLAESNDKPIVYMDKTYKTAQIYKKTNINIDKVSDFTHNIFINHMKPHKWLAVKNSNWG